MRNAAGKKVAENIKPHILRSRISSRKTIRSWDNVE
jgi:hypothetical protein